MNRKRLIPLILTATLLLSACNNPQQPHLMKPAASQWDTSTWNNTQWE